MPKFRKISDKIPRKHPDGRMKGWKVGQVLFHRTLLATAGGPKVDTQLQDLPILTVQERLLRKKKQYIGGEVF